MNNKVISPEEGEELRKLYEELPKAYARASAALRTHGQPLEGELLRKFMEEDAKAGDVVRRIKEIHGTTGQHWMA